MKKVTIGLRLLFAGLALFIGNKTGNVMYGMVLAGICLAFPAWNFVPGFLRAGEGDPDPEKEKAELLKTIKEQHEAWAKTKGFQTKAEMEAFVAEKMKVLEGVDTAKLKEMFDTEKGVFAIIKKQGEEINALKELNKKGAKSGQKTLKDILNLKEIKDKVQKLFANREAGEVVIDISKAAAVMSTANTIDGHDDLPADLIESFSEAQFVPKRQAREWVYDLASVTNVGQVERYITWLEEGDTEGNFAIVEEGALKPLMSADLVRNSSTVRKAAGKYVVTEEFTKFYKRAYEIIQRIIRQQVLRDKADILATDLIADASPYVSGGFGDAFTDPNDYHTIAAVASQIAALNFEPDLVILNPQDKWRVGMQVGEDGHFILQNIPVAGPDGETRMLGLRVRTSTKITKGNFIVGEAGLWEIIQEGLTVRIGFGAQVTGGTSNGGGNVTDVQMDIDHNRSRVIVEQYFHNYLATNNEGSYVYANFDAVKEAIAAGS